MDKESPFGCSCTSDACCTVFSSWLLCAEEALIRNRHLAAHFDVRPIGRDNPEKKKGPGTTGKSRFS